jgi:hypothetical protein
LRESRESAEPEDLAARDWKKLSKQDYRRVPKAALQEALRRLEKSPFVEVGQSDLKALGVQFSGHRDGQKTYLVRSVELGEDDSRFTLMYKDRMLSIWFRTMGGPYYAERVPLVVWVPGPINEIYLGASSIR